MALESFLNSNFVRQVVIENLIRCEVGANHSCKTYEKECQDCHTDLQISSKKNFLSFLIEKVILKLKKDKNLIILQIKKYFGKKGWLFDYVVLTKS